MPIHEKSLIRPENLRTHDKLVIDGVDVSGHWSTFITSRVVTDYNEQLQDEIAAMPGGAHIHRCFQCGSCTNACTVNAIEPRFNPRYWIYLIRMGYESELLRDKDIIWQCVSCHKCTHICPRDVEPEGVMKATAHWLQLKGYTPPSHSHIFDEEFTHQVVQRGRIEDTEVLHKFLVKTKQPLMQDWLLQIARNIAMRLPFKWGLKMMWGQVFKPKTREWAKARAALEEYIHEKESERKAIVEGKAKPPVAGGHRHEPMRQAAE
jgi:heterodisulfide reductase subunit C